MTIGLLKLRRQDSNVRPPGYEPGELPTAPLRDVVIRGLFSKSGAKVRLFFELCKFFGRKCAKILEFAYLTFENLVISDVLSNFAHLKAMCNY